MKIAVTSQIKLPVNLYGGAERVIWDLCRELNALGNEVVLLPHMVLLAILLRLLDMILVGV